MGKAFLRKALTILGTWLIAHSMLEGETADSFAAKYMEPVFGFLLIGASALWTYAYQRYVKRKVIAAKRLQPEATSAELERATELVKA